MVYHHVSQDGARHEAISGFLAPSDPPRRIRWCKVHPSFQFLFEHKKTLEHWCQWCWGIEGPETHRSVFGWLVKLVHWETRKSTAMGNPEIFPGKWSPVVSVAEIIAIVRFDCLGAFFFGHWIWAGRAAWKAKAMSYAAWYQLGFNGKMYFFTVGPGVTRFTCQAIVQKTWLAKLIFWYFAVNGRTSWRNPYANAHFLDTSTKICHVQWLYRLFI